MKVYPVHRKRSQAAGNVESLDEIKIAGVSPETEEKDMFELLGRLASKLAPGHFGGAVLATAGFRLVPVSARSTWKAIRAWNEGGQLFQLCSSSESAGCKTLAGVEEAGYEMRGMSEQAQASGAHLGKRFGMASCGGASIQIGLWGAPPEQAERCVADLGPLSGEYDRKRKSFNATAGLALFSWLANHFAPLSVHGLSDYEVGGLDEMRARYDEWLVSLGEHANPCISPKADAFRRTSAICDVLAAPRKACLTDAWGSYITHLPGAPDPNLSRCSQSVDKFLASDRMLAAWSASAACREAVAGTREWGLTSAFGRSQQLGYDVGSPRSWASILKEAERRRSSGDQDAEGFESEEHAAQGLFGGALTSTLLLGVLRALGLEGSAKVQASGTELAQLALADRGLAPGWIASCPAEAGSITTGPGKVGAALAIVPASVAILAPLVAWLGRQVGPHAGEEGERMLRCPEEGSAAA